MGRRPLIERIGVGAGRRVPVEQALEWAGLEGREYMAARAREAGVDVDGR